MSNGGFLVGLVGLMILAGCAATSPNSGASGSPPSAPTEQPTLDRRYSILPTGELSLTGGPLIPCLEKDGHWARQRWHGSQLRVSFARDILKEVNVDVLDGPLDKLEQFERSYVNTYTSLKAEEVGAKQVSEEQAAVTVLGLPATRTRRVYSGGKRLQYVTRYTLERTPYTCIWIFSDNLDRVGRYEKILERPLKDEIDDRNVSAARPNSNSEAGN